MQFTPLRALWVAGVLAALFAAPAALADDTAVDAQPAPLFAQYQDPALSKLVVLLSHYEEHPRLEQLQALGLADLQAGLVRVAAERTLPNIARGRAITLLGTLPLAGSRAFIDHTLSSLAVEDPYIIGHLVRLVGEDLASQDPQWAMQTLDAFINHPDIGIREWAVVGVGAMRSLPEAQAWADEHLVQLLLAERSPGVRQALNRVLDGVEVLTPAGRPPIVRAPKTTAP
jgi:hypothetical protein